MGIFFDMTEAQAKNVVAQFKKGTSAKEIADSLNLSVEQVAWTLIRKWPVLRGAN